MKARSLIFRTALATGAATAVYLASCGVISAQVASTPNVVVASTPPAGLQPPPYMSQGVGEVVKMYQGASTKK